MSNTESTGYKWKIALVNCERLDHGYYWREVSKSWMAINVLQPRNSLSLAALGLSALSAASFLIRPTHKMCLTKSNDVIGKSAKKDDIEDERRNGVNDRYL